MSVLDALPAAAGADEAAAVCLAALERSAESRGLLGLADLALVEVLRGALDDLIAEADRLAEALTESDRVQLEGGIDPDSSRFPADFGPQNRGDSPPKIGGNVASKTGGMPPEKRGEYGLGSR